MDSVMKRLLPSLCVMICLAGICLAISHALPTQAQFYDCENLATILLRGDQLFAEEQIWFGENCIEEEEEEEEDVEDLRDLISELTMTLPVMTCPTLPPSVAVMGYSDGTQCQIIGTDGIGRTDLIQRGFINAVDVWGFVNGGVEVCIRGVGWLVLLDAAYAPRMLMELEHYRRDGMTCALLDREGTVVLVATPPTPAPSPQPQSQPADTELPVFEAIPLFDCQIKLVQTLFLRSEPGGEIIGLVWLNSEVPAFEINGYWYKVEFEGVIGYISRYYRRVLRGGCG